MSLPEKSTHFYMNTLTFLLTKPAFAGEIPFEEMAQIYRDNLKEILISSRISKTNFLSHIKLHANGRAVHEADVKKMIYYIEQTTKVLKKLEEFMAIIDIRWRQNNEGRLPTALERQAVLRALLESYYLRDRIYSNLLAAKEIGHPIADEACKAFEAPNYLPPRALSEKAFRVAEIVNSLNAAQVEAEIGAERICKTFANACEEYRDRLTNIINISLLNLSPAYYAELRGISEELKGLSSHEDGRTYYDELDKRLQSIRNKNDQEEMAARRLIVKKVFDLAQHSITEDNQEEFNYIMTIILAEKRDEEGNIILDERGEPIKAPIKVIDWDKTREAAFEKHHNKLANAQGPERGWAKTLHSLRETNEKLDLAMKKYQAVEKLEETLACDETSCQRVDLFLDRYQEHRPTIVKRRDSATDTFLKIIGTVVAAVTLVGNLFIHKIWKTHGDNLDAVVNQPHQFRLQGG